MDAICVVNVVDDLSLNVNPAGYLERGMTITIRCAIHYGGPIEIDPSQNPTLTLTLDNEPAFPTGQIYYEAPADSSNLHTKTLVINSCLIADSSLLLLH